MPMDIECVLFCNVWKSREFVKEYSNFEPKKQGVLVTKESLGRKNAIF